MSAALHASSGSGPGPRPAGRSRRRARADGHVGLARALSKLGFASRREAEAWIRAGRVRVDGHVALDPDLRVVPERARIELDGRSVARSARVVLALNKPRGVLVTRHDPERRKTVHELLGELPLRVEAVGRLDQASSGLLLLTNDTRLADWLCDPRSAVPRRYAVTVRGAVGEETLARLRAGIVQRGELLAPSDVRLRKRSRRESHLLVELCEGRNRELRRLFGAVGHEVTRLARVSFGGVELGRLAPGAWRALSAEELAAAFPTAPR